MAFAQTRDPNQFDFSMVWLRNLSIRLDFGVDGISALMVLLVGIVYLSGTLISCKITERIKEFFILNSSINSDLRSKKYFSDS